MNELCFIIDGRALYMEHVLIDYNDDPVFFVCRMMSIIILYFVPISRI